MRKVKACLKFCRAKARALRAQQLSRRHKNLIHGILLLFITLSLIIEGPKVADMLFLMLAVICEVS